MYINHFDCRWLINCSIIITFVLGLGIAYSCLYFACELLFCWPHVNTTQFDMCCVVRAVSPLLLLQ